MPKQLVKPPEEILLAVVTDAVRPQIAKLEKQLDAPIAVTVTLWLENRDDWSRVISDKEADESEPSGEIRISFRETYVPQRWLFFAEAIFSLDIFPGTGFSGFSLTGDVKTVDDGRAVRSRGIVFRYNDSLFHGWR